ncbi:putative leader peptide [Pseudonocardia ammonioxydans]
MRTFWLVKRRHVDLLRVVTAACRRPSPQA